MVACVDKPRRVCGARQSAVRPDRPMGRARHRRSDRAAPAPPGAVVSRIPSRPVVGGARAVCRTKMARTASALPHREEGLRRRCAGDVRARAWAWPASVVALAVGACLLRWPYLAAPISADEGGYATAAYWWARGDALYRGLTITRPQGIFVLFRLIEA